MKMDQDQNLEHQITPPTEMERVAAAASVKVAVDCVNSALAGPLPAEAAMAKVVTVDRSLLHQL